MMHHQLTAPERAATPSGTAGGEQAGMARQGNARAGAMMTGIAILSAGLGGCINIAAPEKPIVIELNINIRQEVIYRLAEDAANTIDENADIF
jgi:hypothetical protein